MLTINDGNLVHFTIRMVDEIKLEGSMYHLTLQVILKLHV